MWLISKARSPKGIFCLDVYRAGRLIERVRDHNLWVTGGSIAVAHLVGGSTTSNSITQIGFGTNSAAPQLTDAALTGAFTQAVGAVTYPGAGQVSFAFTLASGSANGTQISEFGLLTAGGALVARKNRTTPIYKSAAVSLVGSWTIQF